MAVRKRVARKGKDETRPRPRFRGWLSTDAEEIERRRLRGREEAIHVEALETGRPFFGTFLARSDSGHSYRIEIRSLTEHVNSCECPDHRVNGLGTCKHIEAVLHRLERGRKRRFRAAATEGGDRIEIYLDRRDGTVRIRWPKGAHGRSRTRELLAPFFLEDGELSPDALDTLPALERVIAEAPARVRARIRLSQHLTPWLEERRHEAERHLARQAFEADVAAGRQSPDVVNPPLYPYQQQGMLHLAFTGRVLLADEMGLGKTVQAIAACELLRRLYGIRRVLVVAPASLKGEWEEQIAKFTGLASLIIQGPRRARLRQYSEASFFYLANYEQVRPDLGEMNEVLAPDVIILDEAQRIKNWQTRTARAVKRLTSRYAFVLTGTPLENRIDELYSIVEFLDPAIFGPLFRFNRDFYQLDERGRPVGYRNLDALHRRVRPIMLRRRKEEVEGQLPGRTVNTYFVSMHPEQTERYEPYQTRVTRLAALARRRPLTKEEMERLQRYLACMRMLCDTPYILDQTCRISPKVRELGRVLRELTDDGDHKILIFSEWERMLQLVRDLSGKLGLAYAWHTGKVSQPKRRAEIRRFKEDPDCRLFLSTDSGSLGLNLQNADVVINLDLPWNPAKLEQRIARAWRKHQKRPVQVINLVCEHSIEHRMLPLLEQKRGLAQAVVDGEDAVKEMALPSGRAAFLERIEALVGEPPRPARGSAEPAGDPYARFGEEIVDRWKDGVDLLEVHGDADRRTLVVVADRPDPALRRSVEQRLTEYFPGQPHRLEILDRDTFETIQRLLAAGILSVPADGVRTLHRSPSLAGEDAAADRKHLEAARRRFAQAQRKQRMAAVLADGGFTVEALVPLAEAVEIALQSLAGTLGESGTGKIPIGFVASRLTDEGLVPGDAPALVARLRAGTDGCGEDAARALLEQGRMLLAHGATALEPETGR
ncbi:ATP-dependent helicase HepA [bacterium BMS3Bbin12]|nr:ATP-dependent helicase HepA [bacterium BMS3Bbin12]GBE51102.1 ATP-dependent helicase HepA [bacterium BMS3Bbin13]